MVTGMDGNHEKNRSAMDNEGFYTMKGYERANVDELTSSMEDYLEMVCRMEAEGYPVRVSLLAPTCMCALPPHPRCWIT